ncbi:MAG: hypothetical protein U0350_02005 [Caldilineaceae bacterium]
MREPFCLIVECQAKPQAEQVAQHFAGLTYPLPTGRPGQCDIEILLDSEDHAWCVIAPRGVIEAGAHFLGLFGYTRIRSQHLPAFSWGTALQQQLYTHLRTAPAFRYALSGVGIDEFAIGRGEGIYSRMLAGSSLLYANGIVFTEALRQATGAAAGVEHFCPGYVWRTPRAFFII